MCSKTVVKSEYYLTHMLGMHCTFMQPESVQERSDVGSRVSVDVEVSNVGSTTIGTTNLRIYFPAKSSVTGDLFFLLPDCSLKMVLFLLLACFSTAHFCTAKDSIHSLY